MTNVLLYFLIPLAVLATTIALGFGIYSLAKGGHFAKEHSNKLMRLRVMFQGIALLLMALLVVLLGNQG
ncbi:twin transmembrane helix small protein [Parvularcula bermudensis]|nr:twin transmembrane helix small protein [Parvularcula bermudensis]